MRYRVKTKLARVYQLPVAVRLQPAGQRRVRVSVDLSQPLTRDAVTAVVYRLANAWGYMMVFDGDIAHVQAMQEPTYCVSGNRMVFLACNLPTVVDCLLTAGNQQDVTPP